MLTYRKAELRDLDLYFHWVNDPQVREQSFDSKLVSMEDHTAWFHAILKDRSSWLYVFQNENGDDVGQIRIQQKDDREALIGISIAPNERGKGYAAEMLILATNSFLRTHENIKINAYIKETNLKSKFSFEKSGFQLEGLVNYNNIKSFHYTKRYVDR